MLLIPKPKSSPPRLRVVVDLRARNANTSKMTSPLPDMEGILGRVARCRYRSLIDGQDPYEQIRVVPEHVERTAMGTPDGNMVRVRSDHPDNQDQVQGSGSATRQPATRCLADVN
jgi:hypothetical protein